MPRLLFAKQGSAVWISHLDLMRLFQRAFKRAGLLLKHTQGFNPRPSVSIALPLSVGVDSCCELLDFELDGEQLDNNEICERLNQALTAGIHVLDVYDNGRKIRDLTLLSCRVTLEYDNGVPQDAVERIQELFGRSQILLPKKTKGGMQEQDIIPMIRRLEVLQTGEKQVAICGLICCQNPALNPMQLSLAVSTCLPELTPSFSWCSRLEIFDWEENVFR